MTRSETLAAHATCCRRTLSPTVVHALRPLAALVGVATLLSCSSPTDICKTVATLSLYDLPPLMVHESAMLTVVARNARGDPIVKPAGVTFRSSNSAIATVSSEGVVTGVGPGTAAIVAEHGSVVAQTTLVVYARITVTPAEGRQLAQQLTLSVGDSLQLAAWFVDVNGETIGAASVTAWESSNPSSVSVDAAGLAVAHEPGPEPALITARTDEGSASLQLYVQEIGPPATVRFAHAATGVGPITFRAHHLAPVTLTYGQSVELPVKSGQFYVETDGLPSATYFSSDYRGYIPPGKVLSLYATASPRWFSMLTPALSTSDPVPEDSVLLRFVQGSGFQVIRQRRAGERGLGLIVDCYFDPGSPVSYYPVAAGPLEFILQWKPGFYADPTAPYSVVPATLPSGHAVTVVFVGDTLSGGGYLTFVDR